MAKQPQTDERKWIKDIAAGAVAGSICGTVYQPLDVIKTNLIILPTNYSPTGKSSIQVLTDIIRIIYQREGLQGFWMGTTPAVIRTSTSCAIYFSLLRFFDKSWKKKLGGDNKLFSDFVDSGVAG